MAGHLLVRGEHGAETVLQLDGDFISEYELDVSDELRALLRDLADRWRQAWGSGEPYGDPGWVSLAAHTDYVAHERVVAERLRAELGPDWVVAAPESDAR